VEEELVHNPKVDWSRINKQMRRGLQICIKKWMDISCTKRDKFTPEEDMAIISGVTEWYAELARNNKKPTTYGLYQHLSGLDSLKGRHSNTIRTVWIKRLKKTTNF
jgi:hypothetical protein